MLFINYYLLIYSWISSCLFGGRKPGTEILVDLLIRLAHAYLGGEKLGTETRGLRRYEILLKKGWKPLELLETIENKGAAVEE